MIRYVAYRLALIPVVAFGVVTILFLIFAFVPGDQAAIVAGPTATQAEIERVRGQLGLDRPLLVRYGDHLARLARGDLGFSSTFRSNPLPHILERVPATLLLTGAAILVTILIGIPAGVVAAARQGRFADIVVSSIVVLLLAVPNFWLGLIMIAVFAVQLGWLPSLGLTGPASLVMPTIALSARLIALVARMTRGVVIEELRKDYARTARAKGLSRGLTVRHHVLRNAMIPTVTVIGLQAGFLLGGSVVIERLFAWPGIGDLLLTGIGLRDYALVQGITVFFVIGFMLINVVVEILYVLINPRVRYG